MPYRSVNPATGEVLKTFTEHTDQEMMDALAKADNASLLGQRARSKSARSAKWATDGPTVITFPIKRELRPLVAQVSED